MPAPPPPANHALLALLANQVARTEAALEGVDDALLGAAPGGDCHSILDIGRHLVDLRRFQLVLLGSALADRIDDAGAIRTADELRRRLDAAASLVREAIETHDPADWFAVPRPPREGRWGDLPTIERLARPFNDFVNHLGAIRAIRRIHGHPADRTQ